MFSRRCSVDSTSQRARRDRTAARGFTATPVVFRGWGWPLSMVLLIEIGIGLSYEHCADQAANTGSRLLG